MIFEKGKTLSASNRFIQDIKKLPDEVKNNTIILIGPMGTGKSTIAKLISSQMEELDRISLDNREGLKEIYKRRSSFRNFKNFEFVLTGTILSSLKRPHVIDFGAGHSIYENQKLREQMQEMCSEFKNIILLLPSKDKDKSRRILLERRNIELGSNKDKDNWHFLTAPNNYELATKIVYEEGKTPEDISREIIQLVKGEVKSKETDEREKMQMKISGIDKDFEEIEDQLSEEYMGDNFKENIEEKTPLSKREDILLKLEQEAEELLIEEKRIGIFGKTGDIRE